AHAGEAAGARKRGQGATARRAAEAGDGGTNKARAGRTSGGGQAGQTTRWGYAGQGWAKASLRAGRCGPGDYLRAPKKLKPVFFFGCSAGVSGLVDPVRIFANSIKSSHGFDFGAN